VRVLVTGATGFVGKAVVRALAGRGHKVVGFVRDPGKALDLKTLGVELVTGDLWKLDTYVPVVQTVDVVMNAAQTTPAGRLSHRKMEGIFRADELLTRALAEACVDHDKTMIYMSGCFNYGDHGAEWITEETSQQNPSPLGVGHAKALVLLKQMRAEKGLKFMSLSGGFVYGPGGLLKSAFYDQIAKRRLRVMGSGKNYWSPIHVEDFALAFGLAVEAEHFGENFNIDNEPITLRQLADAVTDAMHVERVGTMPAWLMGLILGGPLVASLCSSWRVKN
jgi:nucleoside-diphosphate-sugar epimerase